MSSKTHIRRMKRARKELKAKMESMGLDFNSHADHMKFLTDLHERIKPDSHLTDTQSLRTNEESK